MATNILNVSIPFSPKGLNEMCHEFTFNYLFQTIFINHGILTPYIQGMTYPHLYHLLHRIGKQYFAPGVPVQQGDILIFSTSQNNIIPNNIMANAPVSHSMVAESPNLWFGANNTGTFNKLISDQIPHGMLLPQGRSRVNTHAIPVNYYNPGTGILAILTDGGLQPIYIHIYR